MKRIVITITRYDKPDVPVEERDRTMRGSYRGEPMYSPEPIPQENVLTMDIDETQYDTIKKAALEVF